jgi:hypothetical protein
MIAMIHMQNDLWAAHNDYSLSYNIASFSSLRDPTLPAIHQNDRVA